MLGKIFSAIVSLGEDRRKSYADYYAQKSKKVDHIDNRTLLEKLDRDSRVSLAGMERVLKSLSHRGDMYHLSEDDRRTYIDPVLSTIVRKVERGDVECRVLPTQPVFDCGAIRTGDILAVLDERFPPDLEHKTTIYGVDEVAVPIKPDFGNSKIGRARQKLYDEFPLTTPSAPVKYEKQETERQVDIRRMFILALGYADSLDKGLDKLPLYTETIVEREAARYNRKSGRRTYRGRDY